MEFDSLYRDVQGNRDFLAGLALGDELENLALARCQLSSKHIRRMLPSIRANDLSQTKALLDGGISANTEGPDGITPLMAAAEVG